MLKQRIKKNKGFTLVELMLVLGIFLFITSATLANYPEFNTKVSLSTLANSIAISVREAQVYGVSVKNVSSVPLGLYPSYGVYFSTASNSQASTTQYVFYFDQSETGIFNSYGKPIGDSRYGSTTEKVQSMVLGNGNQILRIFGKIGASGDGTASSTCNNGRAGYTCATGVHINFRRPNPDARICLTTGSTWPISSSYKCGDAGSNTIVAGEVHIIIQSKNAKFKKDVTVYSSGQISVSDSKYPN